jgi:hypothetical protein
MKHYLQDEFEAFVDEISKLIADYTHEHYPLTSAPIVGFDNGHKYWRIWSKNQRGTAKSVYGFVRKEDGAIFRAATWKAPQTKTKSAIRGYLHDEDRLSHCNEYSINYAR